MRKVEAPRRGEIEVVEVRDRTSFAALHAEWNELVSRTDDQFFYRHEFIRLWIQHFAPEHPLRVLTARNREGRLVAALALIETRASILGVPVRQLSAAANAHSPRFDLVAEDAEAAADAFLHHLEADPSWQVLLLSDVPLSGKGPALLEAASARGLPVAKTESLRSPFVPLPPQFELLQKQLNAKFKANLRRRRKRLEERGAVSFDVCSGGDALDARLGEGFALEQSGWKGQGGTAIAQSEQAQGFYTELARLTARHGQLALFFLRLDGRALAFHYGLIHRERYLLLKPAYDEAIGECSPGQLLMDEAFRECIRRGLVELDFLGPDMTWKRDWANQFRPHAHLYLFRDTALGRALCSARFDWGPKAKRQLESWIRRSSRGR